MINCIIIDDEPLAGELLASYIEKIEDLHLLGCFTNPLDGVSFLQQNAVDLVFLDIQMPELSGLQVAKLVKPECSVVFTTAYPDYAVSGFELKALDYLVKPINLQRFLEAVNRHKEAKTYIKAETVETHPGYLFVKSEYRHQKVELSNIKFLKGMGDYVAIILQEGKLLTLEKMSAFESKLPASQFMRIHKSYLVAIDKIDYIERNRVAINGELLPIGPSYQERFWEKINSGNTKSKP